MYKQNPKAPTLKALVGNQKNLNAGLKAALRAAPQSPANQTTGKKEVKYPIPGKPVKKISSGEELTGKKPKANKTFKKEPIGPYKPAPKFATKTRVKKSKGAVAKQTTAGEFAHKQSIKDKKMGKSTKVVDKLTSALEAPFSDKTYGELKKEKRAKQKAKQNAKAVGKQTNIGPNTTGKPKTKKEIAKKIAKKRILNAPKVPGPEVTKKEMLARQAKKKLYK